MSIKNYLLMMLFSIVGMHNSEQELVPHSANTTQAAAAAADTSMQGNVTQEHIVIGDAPLDILNTAVDAGTPNDTVVVTQAVAAAQVADVSSIRGSSAGSDSSDERMRRDVTHLEHVNHRHTIIRDLTAQMLEFDDASFNAIAIVINQVHIAQKKGAEHV